MNSIEQAEHMQQAATDNKLFGRCYARLDALALHQPAAVAGTMSDVNDANAASAPITDSQCYFNHRITVRSLHRIPQLSYCLLFTVSALLSTLSLVHFPCL